MDARVDDDFWSRVLAPMKFEWDEPWCDHLKHLWLVEQISARECGERIGVSRCAIVGKVKRLDIQKRERWSFYLEAKAKGVKVAKARRPRQPTKVKPPRKIKPPREVKQWPASNVIEMFPVLDVSVDLTLRTDLSCDIVGLTHENCHWPVGDVGSESFFFCGQEAIKGRPYCGAHCRIAYEPRKGARPRFRSHSGSHFVGRSS